MGIGFFRHIEGAGLDFVDGASGAVDCNSYIVSIPDFLKAFDVFKLIWFESYILDFA